MGSFERFETAEILTEDGVGKKYMKSCGWGKQGSNWAAVPSRNKQLLCSPTHMCTRTRSPSTNKKGRMLKNRLETDCQSLKMIIFDPPLALVFVSVPLLFMGSDSRKSVTVR